MRSTLSPTLRSRYDYYYSAMSPGSTAANFYENQNQSLFGDPVPPATDFLETLDNHLYGSLRRGSSALASNNAPFLPVLELPRPVPIGGNHLGPKLGTEINNIQRIPLTDRRDNNDKFYSYNRKRSSSSFSDDFRANLDNFRNTHEMLPPIPSKRIFSSEPLYSRRPSNQTEINRQSSSSDSRDSNEWHRPTRPASKNTSVAVTSTIYQLSQNPEKKEMLYKELRKILPDHNAPIDTKILEQMPFLRACIKETLRMYPVVIGNGRNLQSDAVIGGYNVPKGTHVIFPHLVVSNLKEYFPEPERFLPERWIKRGEVADVANCPHAGQKIHPFVSLPFGYGRRMCIGRRFAENELNIIIAKLFRKYQIEFNYGKLTYKVSPTYIPEQPLKFKLTEREQ